MFCNAAKFHQNCMVLFNLFTYLTNNMDVSNISPQKHTEDSIKKNLFLFFYYFIFFMNKYLPRL